MDILLKYTNRDTAQQLILSLDHDTLISIDRIISRKIETDIFCSYAYELITPDEFICIIDDLSTRCV